MANHGIRKVSELIDYEHLSPEELTESKNRHAAESAKVVYADFIKEQRSEEVAIRMMARGYDNNTIADLTGLKVIEIERLRSKS